MKHLLDSSRVVEHEIHSVEEIWTRGIFPFLSQGSTTQYLPLFLVSKKWYNMLCQLERHIFTGNLRDNGCEILSKRIGNATKLLKVNDSMIPYLHNFPNLETLTLIKSSARSVARHDVCNLEKLKSLTVCEGVDFFDVSGFTRLEHLSILHINDNYVKTITIPKNLKYLHIGKRCSPINLLIQMPLKLDYLECDGPDLFQILSYTGVGKLSYRNKSYIPIIYKGGWLDGKYHGKGIYRRPGFKCSGEWVNGTIKFGTVRVMVLGSHNLEEEVAFEYKVVYTGDLLDVEDCICAHGQGKVVIEDQCYEGGFTSGYFNNDRSLVCIRSK